MNKRFFMVVAVVLVLLFAAGAWCYKKVEDQASGDQEWALQLNARRFNATNNRNKDWVEGNKLDLVIEKQGEAIRAESKDTSRKAKAFLRRGNAWAGKKEYERALKDYEEAMRLDPKNPGGYNALAWLKATCPEEKYRDGETAIELATEACDLTAWTDGSILDTLAAAHAEAGDFATAVKYQKQILDYPDIEQTFSEEAHARLTLYEARKPYREAK